MCSALFENCGLSLNMKLSNLQSGSLENSPGQGMTASGYMLWNTEESWTPKIVQNQDNYRALSCKTRALVRRDEESCVRFTKEINDPLNADDLQSVYHAPKRPHFKPVTQVSAVHKAEGCFISDMDEQRAWWAEYFGELYLGYLPSKHPQTGDLWVVDIDPPIHETPPSPKKVRSCSKVKGRKGSCCFEHQCWAAQSLRSHDRRFPAILTVVNNRVPYLLSGSGGWFSLFG